MEVIYDHEYIISSCRCWDRNDEWNIPYYTDKEYKAGDKIEIDGLAWYIDEVIR